MKNGKVQCLINCTNSLILQLSSLFKDKRVEETELELKKKFIFKFR